jgi:uncharacterized BrkB/YihY/UPF0761 family membrane protein
MILFVFLGHVPLVLALAQVGMVYLAWVELRGEPGLSFEVKLWWCLLVFIFNVLGFAAMWVWLLSRRRRPTRGADEQA